MKTSEPSSSGLDNQATDYVVSIAKGFANAIPYAGGFLQEIIGSTIPRQRVDRIADFLARLGLRVQDLQVSIERLNEQKEGVAELVEESTRQAAAAASAMRRAHLANLVASSLQDVSRNKLRASHLLSLLNQMSDLDIIVLAAHAGLGDHDFRRTALGMQRHESGDEARAAMAMSEGATAKLVGLGLMATEYEIQQSPGTDRWKNPLPPEKPRVKISVTQTGNEFLEFLDVDSLPK